MTPPSFHHAQFPPELLAEAKGRRSVSVCLPARDEEATVGDVVSAICRMADNWHLVDEILVMDDGSVDATAEVATAAGAKVIAVSEVLPELGPGSGKGEALWKAVAVAQGDIVVFCDADIRGFDPAFVTGLLGPLLLHDDLAFAKGDYDRPGDGGRVTELVARPLISLVLPHLAGFGQPLAGEFAARREMLEQLPFVEGYGVDLGLLVDAVALAGADAVGQVFLGQRVHRNRPLAELAVQGRQVASVALQRSGVELPEGERLAERPPLARVRPW